MKAIREYWGYPASRRKWESFDSAHIQPLGNWKSTDIILRHALQLYFSNYVLLLLNIEVCLTYPINPLKGIINSRVQLTCITTTK